MFHLHLLLILGCRSNEKVSEGLTETQIVTRASLDLRGRLPSQAELEQAQAQPNKVNDLIDTFLDDDAFGLRVRDLFAGAYRTRSARYFFSDGDEGEFERSAGEEMLKIIEYIAVEDRPFSEVVTADYTFANASMVEHWPIAEYDDEEGGWQMVEYDDGRPSAGVISTNSFHTRYLSNDENYHRSRANALSRILLCDNFLLRPVDFPRNIDLTDDDAIANAITDNAACASCHTSLDPIASFLFGFPGEDDDYLYNAEAAEDWADTTGRAPSFYGIEGDDVSDLGAAIAADPRFSKCATRRVFEGMVGRKATPEDDAALSAHHDVFVNSGMKLKTLIKSVIRDPVYQGQAAGGRTTVGAKIMSPEVLELAILDLTGYQLMADDNSLLRSDDALHVLGGGLSHVSGDYAPTTSNVTRVLVQSQVAEAAAMYLIENESGFFGQIFAEVDMGSNSPDRAAMARLHTLILGTEVGKNDTEVKDLATLWTTLVEEDLDPAQAWAGVVSVLLRDPRFLHY